MRNYQLIGAGCVVATLCSASAWAGVEQSIALSSVPTDVMAVARATLPNAKFHSANTETEDDGQMVYEIQGTTAEGGALEIDVTTAAEVEEIELVFSEALVPEAVLIAVRNRYPGIQFELIEASLSASKKVTGYEFVGQVDGVAVDLDVSADGRSIRESDD